MTKLTLTFTDGATDVLTYGSFMEAMEVMELAEEQFGDDLAACTTARVAELVAA